MAEAEKKVETLREKIRVKEKELQELKSQLANLEVSADINTTSTVKTDLVIGEPPKWPLLPEEYKRYGRQMIVPRVGLKGDCLHITSFCPGAKSLSFLSQES